MRWYSPVTGCLDYIFAIPLASSAAEDGITIRQREEPHIDMGGRVSHSMVEVGNTHQDSEKDRNLLSETVREEG